MTAWATRRMPLKALGYVPSVVQLQLDCVDGNGLHHSYLQVGRCIKTAHGSLVFKIQRLAPWWNGTTIPNHDVYLSVGGCVVLGMEAIFKCDICEYFNSLVVGPTADGTGQISANVGVEPALNDICCYVYRGQTF